MRRASRLQGRARSGAGPLPKRRGAALLWVLMGMLVVGLTFGVLWSQADDMRTRARRMVLAEQARAAARGALAHGLHKVERTLVYFDQRLASRRPPTMDVGKEDPAYLEDLAGSFPLAGEGAKAHYRVMAMTVTMRKAARGGSVLEVDMVAQGGVDTPRGRRREEVRSDFRLYPRRDQAPEER